MENEGNAKMVQEWFRDNQKQVTKGGYGCLEAKKIEPHVLHEQKPMEGFNDGVKQLGERRDNVSFFFKKQDLRDKKDELEEIFFQKMQQDLAVTTWQYITQVIIMFLCWK